MVGIGLHHLAILEKQQTELVRRHPPHKGVRLVKSDAKAAHNYDRINWRVTGDALKIIGRITGKAAHLVN
jgi:hypothetical protein